MQCSHLVDIHHTLIIGFLVLIPVSVYEIVTHGEQLKKCLSNDSLEPNETCSYNGKTSLSFPENWIVPHEVVPTCMMSLLQKKIKDINQWHHQQISVE